MKFKAGDIIDLDDKDEQKLNEPYLVLQVTDKTVYYFAVGSFYITIGIGSRLLDDWEQWVKI